MPGTSALVPLALPSRADATLAHQVWCYSGATTGATTRANAGATTRVPTRRWRMNSGRLVQVHLEYSCRCVLSGLALALVQVHSRLVQVHLEWARARARAGAS